MNKNTALISALFLAILIVTTACIPQGAINSDPAVSVPQILETTEVVVEEAHSDHDGHDHSHEGHSHEEYVTTPEVSEEEIAATAAAKAVEVRIAAEAKAQAEAAEEAARIQAEQAAAEEAARVAAEQEAQRQAEAAAAAAAACKTDAVHGVITSYCGYEGTYQSQVQAAADALPAELKTAFVDVEIVNGCHPNAFASMGRCVYGVWDSAGWDADTHGNAWSRSLWVSNRGVESGRLTDIMVHEAGHAYSFNIARNCVNEDTDNTYREDARTIFGGEEPFADGITAYYNGAGAFQNYRGTGTALSVAETDILEKMFSSC
ncbi:MAG: hypothetical protein P8L22_05150 [Acidimicrobiales bacterium]|nr:hypothetical protein [Acidimicrobiales bacterium]